MNWWCRRSDPSRDEEDLSLLTQEERDERRNFEQKAGLHHTPKQYLILASSTKTEKTSMFYQFINQSILLYLCPFSYCTFLLCITLSDRYEWCRFFFSSFNTVYLVPSIQCLPAIIIFCYFAIIFEHRRDVLIFFTDLRNGWMIRFNKIHERTGSKQCCVSGFGSGGSVINQPRGWIWIRKFLTTDTVP